LLLSLLMVSTGWSQLILTRQDTAKEAIEFSAALRLPSSISAADRAKWV
jgi:hypothetical protein